MRNWIDLFENTSDKNLGVFKGKPFWSGAFDTRDGHIIEVHSYERAGRAGFHHSLYFRESTLDLMSEEEAAFFWIDDRGIQTEWREGAALPAILTAIKSQITIRPNNSLNEDTSIVYHGGHGIDRYFPFFVSPDAAVAQSYASDRKGSVYAFSYHPAHTATVQDLEDIAEQLGIDTDQAPTYELLSPNVSHDAQQIVNALLAAGFDSVAFSDFAMDSDFDEVPAIAILKSGVLSDPRQLS